MSPPRLGTPPTGIVFFPRLQDGGRDEVKGIDQESGRPSHSVCLGIGGEILLRGIAATCIRKSGQRQR